MEIDSNKRHLIFEIQIIRKLFYEERVLYYAAKASVRPCKKGTSTSWHASLAHFSMESLPVIETLLSACGYIRTASMAITAHVKNICILNRLFQPGVRDGFLSSIFRLP